MFPQRDLSLMASVLDEHQIPHVAGWDASRVLWGVPIYVDATQLIINDEHFSTAMDLITNAGYTPCTDDKCWIVQKTHYVQFPDGHFHVKWVGEGGHAIGLYKKSLVYWGLPDFPTEPPAVDDRNFILSNDSRLRTPWDPKITPIKILTKVALAETLISLEARDVDHINWLAHTWHWYMNESMLHGGQDWIEKKDLLPHFHEYWELFTTPERPGIGFAMQDALRDLHQRMLAEGNMPAPPDNCGLTDPKVIEIFKKYGYGTLRG
ncbi:uncharacterized protein LDX57_011369 [Aspergillus melleus]|uniref:uncharacterized protein n=1 Tax=Aspergillus melleus TaxID=138277 RepID=UPI001E8E3BCF|nr:uncharacterized protein LDX57_011369 [Aspergillus melleus]KAH8433735.1 hypothetical protein LDX57_011369 [Aspergillus melleus]